MIWTTNNPRALGLIPSFLSEHDPRPVKEQINEGYAHGGGWSKFDGFDIKGFDPVDPMKTSIRYPGDPPFQCIAWVALRNEVVLVFGYSWVAIVQENGDYEIARLD